MITPEVSAFLRRFNVDAAALKEAGWDAEWFSDDAGDGPYVAAHVFGEACPCCGGDTDGWTFVNVETATGHSQTWHGDNAQCEAEEHARALNAAWKAGAASRSATIETA